MLQEYCFDDYTTLAGIIGEKLVDTDAFELDKDLLCDADQLLSILNSEYATELEGE